MTTPICNCGQTCKHARPRRAVVLTFSRQEITDIDEVHPCLEQMGAFECLSMWHFTEAGTPQQTVDCETHVTVDGEARLITRPSRGRELPLEDEGMRVDGLFMKDVSEQLLRAS